MGLRNNTAQQHDGETKRAATKMGGVMNTQNGAPHTRRYETMKGRRSRREDAEQRGASDGAACSGETEEMAERPPAGELGRIGRSLGGLAAVLLGTEQGEQARGKVGRGRPGYGGSAVG